MNDPGLDPNGLGVNQIMLPMGRDADGIERWQIVSVETVLAIEIVQQLLEAAIARNGDYALLGELLGSIQAQREALHG